MPRNGEAPVSARDVLTASLEGGQTGCLAGRAASGESLRVYVMLGEVLAAHADDDDESLVALLRRAGHLGADGERALRNALTEGLRPAEALFDLLDEETLLRVLFERFRENLYRFLGAVELEPFQPMDAVFTENIQVGHDSRALVDELVATRERVADLADQAGMVLAPGAGAPRSDREQALLQLCGDRVRLGALLAASPFEASRTLGAIRDMLDTGALVGLVPQARRSGRAEPPAPAPDATPVEAAPVEPAPVDPVSSGPLPPEAPLATQFPPAEEDFYDPDEVTAEVSPGGGSDDDDDLAAFQDYDSSRGGGMFSTERDLLDRVDLDGRKEAAGLAASTETVIEMEDAEQAGKDALKSAVSLNFSGPRLSDDDVRRKLEVTSDVLVTISRALDDAGGVGAGQARLQLLVEGSGVAFAPLFKGVELDREGRLPVAHVMKNLRRRPVSEHRSLLNRALSDLTERALSAADEALDDEGLEAMLELIAGYQGRLGI